MRSRTLFTRLLATHLAVAVVGLGVVGLVADRILERRAIATLQERLESQARAVAEIVPASEPRDLQPLLVRLGRAAGVRFTLLRADGVVLADSEHDPTTMENHATRPEVRHALTGTVGSDRRRSDTVRRPFLYVALPPRDGVLVRAALPERVVDEQAADIRRAVGVSTGIAVLLATAIALLAARSVSRPLREVAGAVRSLGTDAPAHAPERGPAEVRAVAYAFNAMAAELAGRIDELRRETGLRELVLSSMGEGVLLAEASGDVVYLNPAAAAMLGDPRKLPPSLAQPGEREMALREPVRRDVRVLTVALEDGRSLVVLDDVSDARRLEAVRRDFVADASHELKTPAASILASAEALEHAIGDDPPAAARFASAVASEAARLARLVEDLLDLASLERDPSPPEAVSLEELVEAEAARARESAAGKGMTVRAEIERGVAALALEADVAVAVRNLLENAVRYTERGEIVVRVRRDGSTVRIEVADTGAGIASKDLVRIFERFYRADKARSRETGGTGLGLSIVRHAVERHGGSVSAASELGRGSTFTITLPAA